MKRLGDSQYFSQTAKLDLIQKQLDGDSTSQKLEALKRLIAMISKGTDSVVMFPYVVKNILSSSVEVKKLVYMYLIHYAERKPDEALLSISHFQKDMTDKNQFIRASALRVLSSIRVPLIAQIVMIAIRKCAGDGSPYVRKVAAIAIPKVYSLNEEEREPLVAIIEKLLGDTNTIVLGAAMFAYAEVCPQRYDLLHRHYRKLCRLMVDSDEWGQVLLVNCLLRYARTQFLDPFKEGYKKKQVFYSDKRRNSDSDSSDGEDPYVYDMDDDHRLLLKSAAPLLQSRNSAVVLAVASLYFHVAPVSDFSVVVRALLRIARTFREAQFVILTAISSMTTERPGVFRPHFKEFFISTLDATIVRELKLGILAKLAVESNAPTILKEFRVYVKNDNVPFVKSVIRAFGRVANNVPEVTDACLNDLLGLINSKKAEVAAEAVVILRHLLQKQAAKHPKIVKRLARMLESIHAPVARASIIWLVGEYHQLIPTLAPDAFRLLTKSFRDEDPLAKLQIITLGLKLTLSPAITDTRLKGRLHDMFQFVLQMAKYDVEYDIRDRTRLLRALIFMKEETEGGRALKAKLSTILLSEKAAPEFGTKPQDQSRFQVASMSHMVNHTAAGYIPLPNFPDTQPDVAIRDVDNQRHLYSDGEDEAESSSEATESSEAESETGSESSAASKSATASDTASETGSDHSAASSASGPPPPPPALYPPVPLPSPPPASPASPPPAAPALDIMDFLGSAQAPSAKSPPLAPPSPASAPALRQTLLTAVQGKGLAVEFEASESALYPGMYLLRLHITNQRAAEVTQVHVGREDLPPGAELIAFSPIEAIIPNGTAEATMHAKPAASPQQPLRFEIWTSTDQLPVTLTLPGCLLNSLSFSSDGSA